MDETSAGHGSGGRRLLLAAIASASLVLLLYGAWMAHRILHDPGIVFLRSEAGAAWIRFDDPVVLKGRARERQLVGFRKRFTVSGEPGGGVARFKFLRTGTVFLDGRQVYDTGFEPPSWKLWHRVDLRPYLTPGPHEIQVAVTNDMGPPALLVSADIPGFGTPGDWEVARPGVSWGPPRLARWSQGPPAFPQAPRVKEQLVARAPVFLGVAALFLAASHVLGRRPHLARRLPAPSQVRWLLLGSWVAFALVNRGRVEAPLGFDASGHIAYVDYLVKRGRIPLATEGWQMFQSPLYYLLGAPLYAALGADPSRPACLRALLALSLLGGALQVEIAYRLLRRVYAGRADLQVLGIVFAGLLPMNVYMGHYIGNEALAGALGGAVILLAVARLYPEPDPGSWRSSLLLGGTLGLALLAKVSAAVLVIPVLAALACGALARVERAGTRLADLARSAALVLGAAFAVAGWYYVRNLALLGAPFLGGWDPRRGFGWWQDPGYRDWGQFLHFGTALTQPLFAGVAGVVDGIYATFWLDSYLGGAADFRHPPPWDFGFQVTGAWLALLPTGAMAAGAAWALARGSTPRGRVLLFCNACAGAFALALVHHCLSVPYYCATKAFYTLGAMPCYVLLAAGGFDLMTRRSALRPVVHALFACWAASSLLSFLAF